MTLGRPRYRGRTDRPHERKRRIGVLLANLGSPAAPTASALRPYLRQFLSDTRVIEEPRWLWLSILNLAVVPFRSPKSAKAYEEVWTDDGSPLIAITRRQAKAVAERLKDLPVDVEVGMSYGEPSIPSALRRLSDAGMTHMLVLPLYPQYAASTVGSVFDSVSRELSSWRWVPHVRFVSGYCDRSGYAKALAGSIARHRKENGEPQLTLFSFHGTQLAALENGDPYHCQCHRTAREAAEAAGIPERQWAVSFQSRFGSDPWLQPYTIEMMRELPGKGVKDLQVICPAFAADCLETLEEIAGENREAFLGAGGERFSYIPALNDDPEHVDFLAGIVRDEAGGWADAVGAANEEGEANARIERAGRTRPLTEGRERPAVKA